MVFITHIYILLDWMQINPDVDLLFLALMSGVVAYCHQEGTMIMKP